MSLQDPKRQNQGLDITFGAGLTFRKASEEDLIAYSHNIGVRAVVDDSDTSPISVKK